MKDERNVKEIVENIRKMGKEPYMDPVKWMIWWKDLQFEIAESLTGQADSVGVEIVQKCIKNIPDGGVSVGIGRIKDSTLLKIMEGPEHVRNRKNDDEPRHDDRKKTD